MIHMAPLGCIAGVGHLPGRAACSHECAAFWRQERAVSLFTEQLSKAAFAQKSTAVYGACQTFGFV